MKLKLISDGTRSGTQVINTETGEKLKYVRRITIDITSDKFDVQVTLMDIEFDVEAESELVKEKL